MHGLAGARNYKLTDSSFLSELCKYDIVLLTETWTSSDRDWTIPGYSNFEVHRPRRSGAKRDSGGLIVMVKNQLSDFVTLEKTNNQNVIWVKLRKEIINVDEDVLVGLCYVTPESSCRQNIDPDVLVTLSNDLVEFNEKYDGDVLTLIAGDFNGRTGNEPDFIVNDSVEYLPVPDFYPCDGENGDGLPVRVSKDSVVNPYGRALLNFCKSTQFRIINGRFGADSTVGDYTCFSNGGVSVVDYMLAKRDLLEYVTDFEVLPCTVFSDHCQLRLTLDFTCNLPTDEEPVYLDNCESVKLKWDDGKNDAYLEALVAAEEKLNDVLNHVEGNDEDNIDSIVKGFTDILHDVTVPLFGKKKNEHCKSKSSSKFRSKWMTEECYTLRENYFLALNTYRLDSTQQNYETMKRLRNSYTKEAKKCRLQFDRSCTDELVKQRKKNAKEFWRLLKGDYPSVKSSVLVAEDFFKYFREISNPGDIVCIADEDVYEYVRNYDRGELEEMYNELNDDVTNDEVHGAIKQLKRGKAAGPDVLINELYVVGADLLVPKLTRLFNLVFKSGHFPESWSEGFIVPVPKKGNANKVDNYRGITLLSTLGKLFTRILNNRLYFWADCYGVLIDAQMGFRPGYSTVDNMFVLNAVIDTILSQRRKLYCAFIDFKKAFDYVNRQCLWYKLLKTGIRGTMFNIIRNMYSNVKSRVKFMGNVSSSFDCLLGVRQGESLSPLLFSMFINDMESELSNKGVEGITCDDLKLCMLLYADDSVILAESRDGLQEGLDCLYDYCQRWKLTVNTDKTKVLVFCKGGRRSHDDHWFYGDHILEVVNKFCYLGVVFSTSGKFRNAQQTLAEQARKAIFALKNHTRQFYDLKPDLMCMLFDKMIVPILSYGSEIWGLDSADQVERVHVQYCKNILKLRQSTASYFVYGELGRRPLYCKRYLRVIKYWLKIVTQDGKPLVKKTYKMLYNAIEADNRVNNWAGQVKKLLNMLGFGEVWLYQGVNDIGVFLKIFEQRVNDNALQLWNHSLTNSSESVLYRELKTTIEYSMYLNTIVQPKFRHQFVKFITRNHKLAVVTGNWHRPRPIPYHQRLCNLCNKVEDEYHVIFECQKYTRMRKKYIPESARSHPSMHKLVSLLTTTDVPVLQNLAIFIYKIFHD